ncbi:MAG: hypothetical protein AAGJ87_13230, partial [Pseudomonadota bacterium]
MATPCAPSVRDAVRQATGRELTDEEADRVVEGLAKRARDNAKRRAARSEAEALDIAARELTDEEVLETLARERMEHFAALKKSERADFVDRYVEEGRGDYGDALRVLNVGEERAGFAAGRSVDAQGRALTVRLYSNVTRRLEDEGLLARLTDFWGRVDENFERAVARDMAHLNGGRGGPSGDAQAAKAAEILNDALEEARRLQNNE